MSFYSGLAVVATKLLTDKGQPLTFTRKTSISFDPIEGKNTTSTTTYTGKGAAFNYNKSEMDGTVVQNGDIRLILNATSTSPILGDTVVIDSIIYKVVNIKPTSPGGTVVMYEIQLRK